MDSFIKSFTIWGLFGYKNIKIDFEAPYKIIVGENGSGKTTIMNCLFYTLSRNFDMLSDIRFDNICIEFRKGKTLEFAKYEVEAFVERDKQFQASQFYRMLSERVKGKEYAMLKNIIYSSETDEHKVDKVILRMKTIGFDFHAPSSYVYRNVVRLVQEYVGIDFAHKIEILDNVMDSSVFYFPTYRRVESAIVSWENITNRLKERYPFLDKEDIIETLNSELIQFGMDDVKQNIRKITGEIKRMTMEGFSSIMGGMLSQLSKDGGDDVRVYSFEPQKIRIILERLGDKVKEGDKESIIKYASSQQLTNKNLNYLIGKLIKLYEAQEEFDTAIKKFRDTCNKYLNDKKFMYDESLVDLYIEVNPKKERIDLGCLSSGEKQIVSLFSKIYLDVENTFIMLLDEPELSLSLTWQEQLLPDIVASEKCRFLLAVTHSPFIYNNDLQQYAAGLADYVKE